MPDHELKSLRSISSLSTSHHAEEEEEDEEAEVVEEEAHHDAQSDGNSDNDNREFQSSVAAVVEPIFTPIDPINHRADHPKRIHHNSLLSGSWWLELLAWLFATLSLAILLIVLGVFNGKALREWHSGISVNTVVSVLSQIAQTAILFPVASGVAQMRFIWFWKKERRLGDMDGFGEGPLDSLMMIWKHPKWALVYLGTLNAFLVLILGSLAQASTQTSLRTQSLDPNSGSIATTITYQAAIPQGEPYHMGPTGNNNHFQSIVSVMELGAQSGVLKPYANASNVIASCRTGNCTFGQYSTMGVCSFVDDMTPSIVKICPKGEDGNRPGCSYTVEDLRAHPQFQPGSLSTVFEPTSLWIGASEINPQNYKYPRENTLVEFYVLYFPDLNVLSSDSKANVTASIIALRGTLDLCLYTYDTNVTNGVTNTSEIDRNTDLKWSSEQKIINRHEFTAISTKDSRGKEYWMDESSRYAFNSYLTFKTFWGATQTTDLNNPGDTLYSDVAHALAPLLVNKPNGKDALAQWLENVAASMTNALRTTSKLPSFSGGTATAPEIYIAVNFRWFIGPIAAVIFVLLFLIAVIFETRRRGLPVWKSSKIPPILCLDQRARTAYQNSDPTKAVDGETGPDNIKVRLIREGTEGWKLVKLD